MGIFSSIGKVISKGVGAIGDVVSGNFGSILGAGLNYFGQESANATNMALSEKQMKFQADMSNTAHQREVRDLKAAGLNPMLSARLGGSSSPAGSMAHVENSAASATQGGLAALNKELIKAQVDQVKSQTALSTAQAANVAAQTPGIQAESGLRSIDFEIMKKLNEAGMRFSRDYHQMDRDAIDAFARRAERNLDWNALQELRQLARERGYSTWQAMVADRGYQQAVLNTELSAQEVRQKELATPRLKADADMWSSSWGKHVAPYTTSAESVSRIVGNGLKLPFRWK